MLRVTQALVAMMHPGSVILNVTSTLESIERMGEGASFYGPAKALQNALTLQLAATLRPQGIVAFSVNPGWVATTMGGEGASLTAQESARALVRLALEADERDAGTFRDYDGSHVPW